MFRKSSVKVMLSMIIAVVMMLSAFGCASQQEAPAKEEPKPAEKKAEAPTQLAKEETWKPERPVTVVVGSGAGGGTDLQSRAMAKALEKILGVPFQVVNMPGGAGGIAASHVWNAKRDGYTILGLNEGVHGMPVLGAFDKTSEAYESIMVMQTAATISVSENSPIKDLDDLVKVAKEKTLKVAASQAGCIWAMKLLQFENATGTKFNQIPYEGSHPSQVAALNGEVDVVVTGFAEQQEYLLAKKLRPIVIVDKEGVELDGYGMIPAVAEKYPKYNDLPPVMQWLGIGMPADMPENIKKAYQEAWAKAVKSKEVQDLAKTTGFKVLGYQGEEAKVLQKKLDSVFAYTLWDAGLAKVDPEKLNIPRP